MKAVFSFFSFSVLSIILQAQSPSLDQWFINNYLINPALAGIENYMDVQMGNRYQWRGVEGAPVSYYASGHISLDSENPNKGFNKITSSASTEIYKYKKIRSHHGVGGALFYDEIGPFKGVEVNLTYAYHFVLSQRLFLSTGMGAGFTRKTMDLSKLSDAVLSDPAINQFNSQSDFIVRPGLWFYGDRFYLGASLSEFANTDSQQDLRTTIITAGYQFNGGQGGIHFTPYGLYRISDISNSYDIGLKTDWRRLLYIGGTYRSTKETVIYVGGSINFLMSIAYLYSVGSEGSLAKSAGGTHEIQLNFRLKNKESVLCPQQMW